MNSFLVKKDPYQEINTSIVYYTLKQEMEKLNLTGSRIKI